MGRFFAGQYKYYDDNYYQNSCYGNSYIYVGYVRCFRWLSGFIIIFFIYVVFYCLKEIYIIVLL